MNNRQSKLKQRELAKDITDKIVSVNEDKILLMNDENRHRVGIKAIKSFVSSLETLLLMIYDKSKIYDIDLLREKFNIEVRKYEIR